MKASNGKFQLLETLGRIYRGEVNPDRKVAKKALEPVAPGELVLGSLTDEIGRSENLVLAPAFHFVIIRQ